MRNNSRRNLLSKRPTAFERARSAVFSLIQSMKAIRSLSCKNPFRAIVKGLRFPKVRVEQIPTAIREETTKRVNCHKIGNLPLFCIEKDTRSGVLYAPFACVLMVRATGLEPAQPCDHKNLNLTRLPIPPCPLKLLPIISLLQVLVKLILQLFFRMLRATHFFPVYKTVEVISQKCYEANDDRKIRRVGP